MKEDTSQYDPYGTIPEPEFSTSGQKRMPSMH